MNPRAFTTLFLTTLLSGTVYFAPNSALAKGGGGGYGGGSRGGSVHVSDYTRHDGTYVHSYTRSTPGSGSRYKGDSGYSADSEYKGGSEYSGSSNATNTTSDIFQDALDSAMSAATITQSAVSKDDWELVSSKWQDAINLLEKIPVSSLNYAGAQVKIQEYGRNLNYAQQQLNLPPLTQTEKVASQKTLNDKSQLNGESLTENSASVAVSASSPLPNTSTEQASSLASSQDAFAAPVSQLPKVAPPTPTVVTPDSSSRHLSEALILTILAVIVAASFYGAKMRSKAKQQSKAEKILLPPTNDFSEEESKKNKAPKTNEVEPSLVPVLPLVNPIKPSPVMPSPISSKHSPENFGGDAAYAGGGAVVGAGVAATVGGMGLAVGGTAVGIGTAPIVAAGAVAGLAVSGAKKAIDEGDATALRAVAGGAAIGAGVSTVVGGMGLAVGGTAVAVGIAPVAAVGAVVGLAGYGFWKLMGGK